MRSYRMYVDENGHEHRNHYSKFYILVGCIVEEDNQDRLKTFANLLKYRYWKTTNIVLHSKEIPSNSGPFAIFRDNPTLKKEFVSELCDLLLRAPVKITYCLVDKQEAFASKWNEQTIVRKSTDFITQEFLKLLYSYDRNTGRIIYEASGFSKDAEYLRSFNKILTPPFEKAHPEFNNARTRLTSVSFATKLNQDIECQLADIFSYAAYVKYMSDIKGIEYERGSYESKIKKILEQKLLLASPGLRKDKKSPYDYMSTVIGHSVLPEKRVKKKRTA